MYENLKRRDRTKERRKGEKNITHRAHYRSTNTGGRRYVFGSHPWSKGTSKLLYQWLSLRIRRSLTPTQTSPHSTPNALTRSRGSRPRVTAHKLHLPRSGRQCSTDSPRPGAPGRSGVVRRRTRSIVPPGRGRDRGRITLVQR